LEEFYWGGLEEAGEFWGGEAQLLAELGEEVTQEKGFAQGGDGIGLNLSGFGVEGD
jgi:hypothetical protein